MKCQAENCIVDMPTAPNFSIFVADNRAGKTLGFWGHYCGPGCALTDAGATLLSLAQTEEEQSLPVQGIDCTPVNNSILQEYCAHGKAYVFDTMNTLKGDRPYIMQMHQWIEENEHGPTQWVEFESNNGECFTLWHNHEFIYVDFEHSQFKYPIANWHMNPIDSYYNLLNDIDTIVPAPASL